MGKIKQGILGGFNGTVGTVVGASWKGISYMRGKAQSIRNPRTPAQKSQRAFFAEISSLASQLSDDELKTFFPRSIRGMSRRNLLVRQLSEAFGFSNGRKVFDPSLLSSLGNAPDNYNFGDITVNAITETVPGTDSPSFIGLRVSFANSTGDVLNNYGAFLVFNTTKGTLSAANSTVKMNTPSITISAKAGWDASDDYVVLPFLYESQVPVTNFGYIVKTKAEKDTSSNSSGH